MGVMTLIYTTTLFIKEKLQEYRFPDALYGITDNKSSIVV